VTWFKVDDGFWSHPKTATLSDAAVTLWVRAGAYSCQHLTDGVIARPVLRLVGTTEAAGELVGVGLWLDHPDGWVFHDWDEYQETSEAVKRRRDDARDRQQRARERAANKRRESRVTDGVTDGVSNAVSSLYPTRPDPTTTSKEVDNPRTAVAFERAYASWPKKVEKKKSLDKFKQHAKKHDPEWLADQVVRFGRAYAANVEKQFTPALSVWLNGERWTDELPTAGHEVVDQQWNALMGASAAPCANGHRWLGDGTCMNCTERRSA